MLHRLTFYPSLLNTSDYKILEMQETTFHDWLRSFLPRPTKNYSDPAFGPYILPHGKARTNSVVTALTMAVFDVDLGVTEANVDACDATFGATKRLWYPSFRHTPEAPRYRLIVPFEAQLPAAQWASVRAEMIAKHQIPADLKTSNSVSHAYYVPSGPVPLRVAGERALEVKGYTYERPPPPKVTLPEDWAPRERGQPKEELQQLIEQRIKTLKRKADERYKLLEAVLEGKALADHGIRDVETTRAAALLVYALPDAGLQDILDLLRGSLEVMQADGSTLTEWHVERKIESAMRKRAESVERISRVVGSF